MFRAHRKVRALSTLTPSINLLLLSPGCRSTSAVTTSSRLDFGRLFLPSGDCAAIDAADMVDGIQLLVHAVNAKRRSLQTMPATYSYDEALSAVGTGRSQLFIGMVRCISCLCLCSPCAPSACSVMLFDIC